MKKRRILALTGALAAVGAAAAVRAPSWAVAVLPSGHEYALEVAADEASRSRGYMGREKIGSREGMIFIFEEDGRHTFWMKDCKASLDMVWLDAHQRIVWVEVDRKPCPPAGECPTIVPPTAARFVIEFAAGTVRAEALKPGDAIVVLSDPPLR